jgi:hypothetical protein
LTFGQSAQYESCGQYSNLFLCKISHFFEVPKYFSYFYSLLFIYSNWKNHHGPLSPCPTQLGADSSTSPHVKSARAVCFLETLPSGHRRLTDPTYQPNFFTGGKPLSTRPATTPVTAQTRPLPLLRHRRSSPAKFPSTGRPPVTTPHHKDNRMSTYHIESSRRLRSTVATHHRCPPVKFRPRPAPRFSIQASMSCRHIPSLAASPVNRWQAALPLRRCVALISLSTAVKAVAPPRCRHQAPGDKASRSASASSFLADTACGRLASSSLAPRHVGTMRWHTHARYVALSSATPWLAHLSQRRTDKCPPRRLHTRSLPL